MADLRIVADIETVEVKSEVADQPISEQETKQGSINRAKKALEQLPEADLALGIEVGYCLNQQENYEMFCWTSLIDKKGRQISAQSQKLLLPSFHQKILKEGKYLGEYVRQYLLENPDYLSQYIGIIIRDRKPFIKTATELALLNYLAK